MLNSVCLCLGMSAGLNVCRVGLEGLKCTSVTFGEVQMYIIYIWRSSHECQVRLENFKCTDVWRLQTYIRYVWIIELHVGSMIMTSLGKVYVCK